MCSGVNMADSHENQETRIDLAVTFRALNKLGYNEGIDNNISVVAPGIKGTGNVTLINPNGLHWSEIRASSLVGVNEEGKVVEGDGQPTPAAVAVHAGIRKVRPDSICIMHTHSTYATTLGILRDPTIKLYHQNSARVCDRVAYLKEYSGLLTTEKEGRELGQLLGDRDGMIMQNHGALTCGINVAGAFHLMYYIERACMFQVKAYSTGQPLKEFPSALVQQLRDQYSGKVEQNEADRHFAAIKRKIIKETSDVLL